MPRTKCLLLLASIFCSATYAGTPIAQRHQEIAYSRTELFAISDLRYHNAIEEWEALQILDQSIKLTHLVRSVATRIIEQAGRLKPESKTWDWQVKTVTSPEVDAESYPSGKIILGTRFIRHYGLTQCELAMVIGHEVAHAIADHVLEQASAVLLSFPLNPTRPLDDVLDSMDSDFSTMFRLEDLLQVQEQEADRIGLILSAMAGYDPRCAIQFFAKLVEHDPDGMATILPTHGSPKSRKEHAANILPEAINEYLSHGVGGPRQDFYKVPENSLRP